MLCLQIIDASRLQGAIIGKQGQQQTVFKRGEISGYSTIRRAKSLAFRWKKVATFAEYS
jgi:hypothetical protein